MKSLNTENIDAIAGAASVTGSVLKSMKHRHKIREYIINAILAFIFAFGLIGGLMWFLPAILNDIRLIVFFALLIGFFINLLTEKIEVLIVLCFDVAESKIKSWITKRKSK
jgi:hypothetical protein